MEKQRMKLAIDEEAQAYIHSYKEEKGLRYTGDAIAQICKEHEIAKSNEWSLKYISEVVSNHLHTSLTEEFHTLREEINELKQEMKKVRLGTNAADKNTQILIEYMNGLFAFNGFKGLITTDMREMDSTRLAREAVEKRIAHQRQQRIDWEESRGKKSMN
ncbi:hypothetical protein ACWGPZ_26625 [Priestia megaterium]